MPCRTPIRCQFRGWLQSRKISADLRAKLLGGGVARGLWRERGGRSFFMARVDNSRGAANLSPNGFPKGKGRVTAPHLKGGNNGILLLTSTTTCPASPGIQLILSCSAGELRVIAEEKVEKSNVQRWKKKKPNLLLNFSTNFSKLNKQKL